MMDSVLLGSPLMHKPGLLRAILRLENFVTVIIRRLIMKNYMLLPVNIRQNVNLLLL